MNLPTRINPNPARNMNGCLIKFPISTPTFVIEKKIEAIIYARLPSVNVVRLTKEGGDMNLEIDPISNLEILMDIEEAFLISPGKIEDEEFGQCKTFNQMVACVRKAVN